MKKNIIIDKKEFQLIKVQRMKTTAIYKHKDSYLRIGDPVIINHDLENHQRLMSLGFPVAKILEQGSLNNQNYYLEQSLGDSSFSELFADDFRNYGIISDNTFDEFLKSITLFANAQVTTITDHYNYETFAQTIHLEALCKELPEYAVVIRSMFENSKNKLTHYPFVLSHGDLCAHNMFPDGIIDFENVNYAPFGYDLVGALIHIDYFPDNQGSACSAAYRFNPEQKKKYFELIDSLADSLNLPCFSKYAEAFEFCKAIWLLVGTHAWPDLQKFRYNLFIERFL
jgi:hypothetical protein